MNTDIKHYLKVYNNWLDPIICDLVVSSIENTEWHQHTYINNESGHVHALNGDNELSINHHLHEYSDYLLQRNWDGFKKYIDELKFPWFTGWSGFSTIRYNRYDENTLMSNHCDHIITIFDGERKGIPFLTALMVLNDEYEGGEFIMWETDEIKVKKGDLIIFPSNFLYPHKVQPITKGRRYSCVTWAY